MIDKEATVPLNPTLYSLLQREFGSVRIAHEGDGMRKNYAVDYGVNPPKMKLVPPERGFGEYYRVRCCFCGDTRGRLWINHLWGVWDPVIQGYNLWLAVCFNEQCLSDPDNLYDLFRKVYGFKNYDQRTEPLEILQGNIDDTPLREVTYPGDWVPLADLGPSHPANQYLWARGYGPEVCEKYKLSYCDRALYEYRAAERRIIIPVFMSGTLVGWQCRYVGELDWKNGYVPKYYNMPGMKRRQILYNYDTARKEPYVVIVEGVTGVWNLGDNAVALLGKSLSGPQIEMIIKTWKVVVVLMDGDEAGKEAAQEIYDGLKRYVAVVVVTMPPGRDSGDSDAEWLWALIKSKAEAEGIDLDLLAKGDTSADGTKYAIRDTGDTNQRAVVGGGGGAQVGGGGLVPAGAADRPRYAAPRTQLY